MEVIQCFCYKMADLRCDVWLLLASVLLAISAVESSSQYRKYRLVIPFVIFSLLGLPKVLQFKNIARKHKETGGSSLLLGEKEF